MIEALHLGSMLPATLGACCVAGGADRRSPTAWAGMVVMVAAMADRMLLPAPFVPAAVWAAALVAIALATALGARLDARRLTDGAARRARAAMAVHRALQGLLMAGLLVTGSAAHSVSAHTAAARTAHSHSPLLAPLLLAGAAGFAAFSGWLALRHGGRLQRGEAALGGLAVAAMAAAALL